MPRKAAEEDYAEIYYEAAKEHKALAQELHEAGRYVMAHYLAGLAVECILRAYHYRLSPVFSGRHNLQTLYWDAQFDDVVPLNEQGKSQCRAHRDRAAMEQQPSLPLGGGSAPVSAGGPI